LFNRLDHPVGNMKTFASDKMCIGLDRLATWDEVCCALACSAKTFSQPGSSDGSCGLEPEFVHCFDVGCKEPARVPLTRGKLTPRRK
jgi:hypothetical protein